MKMIGKITPKIVYPYVEKYMENYSVLGKFTRLCLKHGWNSKEAKSYQAFDDFMEYLYKKGKLNKFFKEMLEL